MRTLLKDGEKVHLYAISVDDPATSKDFADKIAKDGRGPIAFPILSDQKHQVIDAFGLHDPAYNGGEFDGIPHASVYVLDASGRVVWARIEPDYRKRPTNAEIRAVLDQLAPR